MSSADAPTSTLFFLMTRRPPRSTLFPSPTLFRSVAEHADAPSLTVSAASGTEDTPISLSISAALVDLAGAADPDETLSITIGSVPLDATLSAGTNNGGGSWTLTPAQLSGPTTTPPSSPPPN